MSPFSGPLPSELERQQRPDLEHRVLARELQRSRRSGRRTLQRERIRRWRGGTRNAELLGATERQEQGIGSSAAPSTPAAVGVAVVVIVAALVRMAAQVIADVSAGSSPFYGAETDAATLAFGVGLLLAGTMLPLALVQRWGTVWPRWLPGVAGRAVPRWLLLVPAGLLAGGMTVVFGTSMVRFLLDPSGSTATSDYPPVFWWFVLPAYLVWGVGLLVLVVAYWTRTRPR